MTVIRPYYSADSASTLHYDLVALSDSVVETDVELYASLISAGGSVLELGAGTGRVAIPLAERGFEVTGLDIAAGMLVQAEEKRAALSADTAARLRFVRGDMRSLALGRQFDAIIAAYFTIAHVQPSVAWKQVFAGMARHLAPGGTIALHLPDPVPMRRPAPRPDLPVLRKPVAEGWLSLFVVAQAFDEKAGRFDLTLDYVVSAADGRELHRSRERYTLFHGDPLPFAAKAGLRLRSEPQPLGTGSLLLFESAH